MNMTPRQYVMSNGNYATALEMYIDHVNSTSKGDIFKFDHSGNTDETEEYLVLDKIIDLLRSISKEVQSRYLSNNAYILTVEDGDRSAVVYVVIPERSSSWRNIDFMVVGERHLGLAIMGAVTAEFATCERGTIRWYRKVGNTIDSSTIVIENKKDMHAEFYPWIQEGVDKYIDRFMESEASILLMVGPPGTGKTSFLRHMISSRNLIANVTYDEDLLSADEFFYSFITSKSQLMVIEDADNLISSRDSGNRLIPRFLNTAEGLVKIGKKKMVFTTNLPNVQSVDEALVRPGRCFDVMKTRQLTHKEMMAATSAAGLTYIVPVKEEYSLSEIFSSSKPRLNAIRKVGF